MIIVLKQNAPEVQVREFCHELQDMGLQINDSKGSESHILGLIGDTKAVAESWVLANPVVETCRRAGCLQAAQAGARRPDTARPAAGRRCRCHCRAAYR